MFYRRFYHRLIYVIFLLSLISLPFFLSSSLFAQDFEGKVVSITDGDTISVMHNGVPEKIRLNGIDCPESSQAFSNKAKQFTGDTVFGKTVTIKEHGKDKYGRTIGDVLLPDGANFNKELVKAGFAWWYRQYSNDKELEQLEQEARVSKRGLWSDPNPVAPWDWRHNPSFADNSTLNISPTDKLAASDASDIIVYVTKTGSKYHRAGCRYLKSVIPIKLSEASSRYTPCSVCNPPTLDSPNTNKTPSEYDILPAITGTPTGETTPRGYQIYEGPRGGRYHYSKSGKKVYEKRKGL
jgi:endonuclease YncB( thermonuclease family)